MTVYMYTYDFHANGRVTARAVPRPSHGPLAAAMPPPWLAAGARIALGETVVTVVEVSDLVCLVDSGTNRCGIDTATIAAHWQAVR